MCCVCMCIWCCGATDRRLRIIRAKRCTPSDSLYKPLYVCIYLWRVFQQLSASVLCRICIALPVWWFEHVLNGVQCVKMLIFVCLCRCHNSTNESHARRLCSAALSTIVTRTKSPERSHCTIQQIFARYGNRVSLCYLSCFFFSCRVHMRKSSSILVYKDSQIS